MFSVVTSKILPSHWTNKWGTRDIFCLLYGSSSAWALLHIPRIIATGKKKNNVDKMTLCDTFDLITHRELLTIIIILF